MEYILRHAENQMQLVNTTKRNQAPKLLFVSSPICPYRFWCERASRRSPWGFYRPGQSAVKSSRCSGRPWCPPWCWSPAPSALSRHCLSWRWTMQSEPGSRSLRPGQTRAKRRTDIHNIQWITVKQMCWGMWFIFRFRHILAYTMSMLEVGQMRFWGE